MFCIPASGLIFLWLKCLRGSFFCIYLFMCFLPCFLFSCFHFFSIFSFCIHYYASATLLHLRGGVGSDKDLTQEIKYALGKKNKHTKYESAS